MRHSLLLGTIFLVAPLFPFQNSSENLLEEPFSGDQLPTLFAELEGISTISNEQNVGLINPTFLCYPYFYDNLTPPTGVQPEQFPADNVCPIAYSLNEFSKYTSRKRSHDQISPSYTSQTSDTLQAPPLCIPPHIALEEPEHLQWFELLVRRGSSCAISHIRRTMRSSIDENLYPGSCTSLLKMLQNTARQQPMRIKYFNTVATVLKLIALDQKADLSASSPLAVFFQGTHTSASQLHECALNTSREASEEFFKESEFTAKELQKGIGHKMFHPSMIELIGSKKYEYTTFIDCMKAVKESVKSYDQRRDILQHHYTKPPHPTHKLPEHDKNRQAVILMFLDWIKKDKSLAILCPNELTMRTDDYNKQSLNNNVSQQINARDITPIINSIALYRNTHTPDALRSLLATHLQMQSNATNTYAWSVLFPFEQYECTSYPEEAYSPQILTNLPLYDLNANDPLPSVQDTTLSLSPIDEDRERASDTSAAIMIRIAVSKYDYAATHHLLQTICHAGTFHALIEELQADTQATETHITMAKLFAIKLGVNLAPPFIGGQPNALTTHSALHPLGIQRKTHSLDISEAAAEQFFSDKHMSLTLITTAMKAGMFHEALIYLFLKRAPCHSSFNRLIREISPIITEEQHKTLCAYYINNKPDLMSYYKCEAEAKGWTPEDIQEKLNAISIRMNTFYNTSYSCLSSRSRKKRTIYEAHKIFTQDKWSNFTKPKGKH